MEKNIRVSAAYFIKILIEDRYLLILNKIRYENSNKSYTPVGGAIKYYNSSLSFLDSIGCAFENDENDLRFSLPYSNLSKFLDWFNLRQQREVDAFRELKEELVGEEKIFKELLRKDVSLDYLFLKEEESITDRPRHEGELTHRFIELYNARFNRKCEQILLRFSQTSQKIVFASEKEILQGIAKNGLKIASISQIILND